MHIHPSLNRYSRQILFERIGVEGQQRLLRSRVTLIGCGALGTVLANTLVRSGVGFLRICDRDYIERDNLQRQVLFDEDDIAANLPKAQAAARKLSRMNSEVTVEPIIADVNSSNIESFCDGADLILDGTDNFETRFLINDLAVRSGTPWIYGAVIGATGLCMVILPGETPCLRCVFEDAPPPEMNPTCDTAGVLSPAVNLVAGFQAMEAIKLLAGKREELNRALVQIDAWSGRVVHLSVQSARDGGDCPCCRRRDFAFLLGRAVGGTATLCGRNAVQVTAGRSLRVSLESIAQKLAPVAAAPPRVNPFLLKATVGEFELTVFPDGRAIIKGTSDPDVARSIYAKYVGA